MQGAILDHGDPLIVRGATDLAGLHRAGARGADLLGGVIGRQHRKAAVRRIAERDQRAGEIDDALQMPARRVDPVERPCERAWGAQSEGEMLPVRRPDRGERAAACRLAARQDHTGGGAARHVTDHQLRGRQFAAARHLVGLDRGDVCAVGRDGDRGEAMQRHAVRPRGGGCQTKQDRERPSAAVQVATRQAAAVSGARSCMASESRP